MHTISKTGSIYEIRLNGEINTTLLNLVDNMQLTQEAEEKVIKLVGWLPDQSSLLGLLISLDEIRYEILSIEIFSNNKVAI
ncbi:MAG: hypothetical protein WBN50_13155 [Lutimonas sp.]